MPAQRSTPNPKGKSVALRLCALCAVVVLQSCAEPYTRGPLIPGPTPRPPQAATAPSVAPVPESKPAVEQPNIKERDLKESRSAGRAGVGGEATARLPPQAPTEPLPDDSSLVAKISPQTSPRRAASLRLTEEGKKLLAAADYSRALAPLERSIAVDSTNPYGYFYLAKAQYLLGRYQESLDFLDVAESRLVSEPYWLAEVFALRGDNFRALGFLHRAETSYEEALKVNPGSKAAADGISRLRSGSQRPSP